MRPILAGAAMLGAVLMVYVPHVQRATFVFEDDRSLDLVAFPGWATMLTTGRGVTRESFRHPRSPEAAHAVNVGLHLLVVLLAGVLIWLITGTPPAGLIGAGIVALHPVTVESVAYATSRAELIAAVGALGSLVAVLVRVRGVWLLAPACLLLAYTGKETGLVAVALIPLVLWAAGRERRAADACWVIGGALAVTSALWLPHVLRLTTIGFTPRMTVDGVSWLLTQAEAVWRLVVLSVAPFWLSVAPVPTARLVPGVAALLLLIGLIETAWRQRHTRPLLTLGIVWCAIVAVPRFLVRTPLSPFNEHQWYFAVPGVACCWMAALEALETWWVGRRTPCPA